VYFTKNKKVTGAEIPFPFHRKLAQRNRGAFTSVGKTFSTLANAGQLDE